MSRNMMVTQHIDDAPEQARGLALDQTVGTLLANRIYQFVALFVWQSAVGYLRTVLQLSSIRMNNRITTFLDPGKQCFVVTEIARQFDHQSIVSIIP